MFMPLFMNPSKHVILNKIITKDQFSVSFLYKKVSYTIERKTMRINFQLCSRLD